ncbi:MAG TPA: hypothetical protein VMN43_04030 [Aestuariivirgaceae bacterium]|nr:hypothetical protein [Aestuariivirgaceae bacterium]
MSVATRSRAAGTMVGAAKASCGVLDKPDKPSAAPGGLKTAPLNETDDDYPLVVARLNARWRVIDGKCGLQWIVQHRSAGISAHWRSSAYCRTLDGLMSNIRERCGDVEEAGWRAVERLPERHG